LQDNIKKYKLKAFYKWEYAIKNTNNNVGGGEDQIQRNFMQIINHNIIKSSSKVNSELAIKLSNMRAEMKRMKMISVLTKVFDNYFKP
jgi:hypothetical protein